ncbi:MAG: hypothetical protein ONB23_04900 [candidate division KSB1 bacterium]|nr:hypothetical protein [candidate division KSB1 bacterium]
MITFREAGPENTEAALDLAFQTARERGLRYVVVASTSGETARKAAQRTLPPGVQLVVVTHNTGFRKPGEQEFDVRIREELRARGVAVVTGTLPTRGINRAIRDRFGGSELDLISAALRILGEGVKVCVEIACMACDAGAVPPEDVVCVAGTGRGADTVAIVHAQPSNKFFDVRVREIVAKPYRF